MKCLWLIGTESFRYFLVEKPNTVYVNKKMAYLLLNYSCRDIYEIALQEQEMLKWINQVNVHLY